MSETFTEQLRAESDWEAATRHRFTRELHADELDDAAFRRYLVQDYAFVGTLGRVVGLAVAQAPTREAQARLSEFLAVLAGDEGEYFRRSFDALGVAESEWRDPALAPVTREFEDFLLRAAREGGYEETVAILLAVEWVYLDWATAGEATSGTAGETDPESAPSRPYLREWIDLHATDEFAAFVGWLRDELDRYGPELNARRRERLFRNFERAVELEVAFFDAAYDDGD
jgi:thiaminase/transcriptional activator TenA